MLRGLSRLPFRRIALNKSAFRAINTRAIPAASKNTSRFLLWGALGFSAASLAYNYNSSNLFAEQDPRIETLNFHYVVIGRGAAAFFAIQAIRKQDPEAPILVVEEEASLPYTRKALVQALRGKEPKIWSLDEFPEYLETAGNITVLKNERVLGIEPGVNAVVLSKRRVVEFKKCLIASGTTPVLPSFDVDDNAPVSYFEKLEEAVDLRNKALEGNKTIVVVGDSSWASTVVETLNTEFLDKNNRVKHVLKNGGVYSNILPTYLSEFLNAKCEEDLVEVIPNATISSITSTDEEGSRAVIQLANGETIEADHVVVVSDLVPNTDFALLLESDKSGIIANPELQASSNIYVAGEVASHYNAYYGRRQLLGERNEILSGNHVGQAMASNTSSIYDKVQSYSYELADQRFTCVGKCDSSFSTLGVWLKPPVAWADSTYTSANFERGLVYYLGEHKRLVGILGWNLDLEEDPHIHNQVEKLFIKRYYKTYDRKEELVSAIILDPVHGPQTPVPEEQKPQVSSETDNSSDNLSTNLSQDDLTETEQ